MTSEFAALRCVPPPDVEERIKHLRRCYKRCPMIDNLDKRMENQIDLVKEIVRSRGMTFDDIKNLSRADVELLDTELKLCWNVIHDVDYIDSLR